MRFHLAASRTGLHDPFDISLVSNIASGGHTLRSYRHAAAAAQYGSALAIIAAFGCAPHAAPGVKPDLWRAAFPGADSLRVERVVAGVEHVYAWMPIGPWAIHILAIDVPLCRPILEVAHPGPPLTAAAGVTAIADRAADHAANRAAQRAPVLAAINADFFALPAGTPVGAEVSQSEIHVGPGRRPVFAVTDSGFRLWTATLRGVARNRTEVVAVEQVNRPRAGDAGHPRTTALTMFTEWWGRPATVDSSAITLGIRITWGTPTRGKGVVTATTKTGTVPIGPGRIALQGDTGVNRTGPWLARRVVGDTLEWNMQLQSAEFGSAAQRPHVFEAVGGFPILLRGGHVVTDAGEPIGATFGPVRHPRTAIGWSHGGNRLLWIVVDGRQKQYSDGMTLAELTALFQQLGATDAMNLDGGGSTTMLIRDRIVNRVSDPNGERAVGNAILLKSCRISGKS